MKELMNNWVEHTDKDEDEQGRWSAPEIDALKGKTFASEQDLDEALWEYIMDNPEDCIYFPMKPFKEGGG